MNCIWHEEIDFEERVLSKRLMSRLGIGCLKQYANYELQMMTMQALVVAHLLQG